MCAIKPRLFFGEASRGLVTRSVPPKSYFIAIFSMVVSTLHVGGVWMVGVVRTRGNFTSFPRPFCLSLHIQFLGMTISVSKQQPLTILTRHYTVPLAPASFRLVTSQPDSNIIELSSMFNCPVVLRPEVWV